ncbi:PREDICTED: uncharacterized protein LOC105365952 [Ceratosolen solmsi marchali]|uniref:Uncharacterized protein LOC105365952 n=1 Tax=Ceratosolen solmsi marchali TaxID=326594 RepID=A0AAJ6YQX2_9HYME|nr:PREDICTED: uncharacterized protein LOC105365952 [Ceratosolen solmsi marchali]
MCDFLPMSVHAILNDVETSLSLPVLIVLVLCILQFLVYHMMHLACTLRQILCKKCEKKRKQKGPKSGSCIMKCLKAFIRNIRSMFWFLIGGSPCSSMEKIYRKNKNKPSCKRLCTNQLKSNNNDWNDNDEEDEDE